VLEPVSERLVPRYGHIESQSQQALSPDIREPVVQMVCFFRVYGFFSLQDPEGRWELGRHRRGFCQYVPYNYRDLDNHRFGGKTQRLVRHMPYGYPAGEDREHKKRFKGKEIAACLVLFLSICRPLSAQSSYDNDTLLWDSLDSERQWSINTAGSLGIDAEYKTEGRGSLSVVVKGSIPAMGLILKKSNTDLDVTFARNIILDIYNSGPPCNLAVAFKTDGLRESLPRRIESGLNRNVTFEISAKDFKAPFGDANIASEVMFVVYPADGALQPLFFDNVRIRKYGGLESPPINIIPALLEENVLETPSALSTESAAGLYSILSGMDSYDEYTVPEHMSFLIFGAGLAGFAFFRKKYFKK